MTTQPRLGRCMAIGYLLPTVIVVLIDTSHDIIFGRHSGPTW
jgi:hypothetical protein